MLVKNNGPHEGKQVLAKRVVRAVFRRLLLGRSREDWQQALRTARVLAGVAAGLPRLPRLGRHVVFRRVGIADTEKFFWRPPRAHEVLVRMTYSAVSVGTESAVLLGLPNAGRIMPLWPAASGCGEVISTGRKTKGISIGDHVAGNLAHGTYAITDAARVTPIGQGAPSPLAALVDQACVVQQGMRKASIRLGEHTAIVGTGLFGQLSMFYAALLGAGRLTFIGRDERGAAASKRLMLGQKYIVTTNADAVAADVVVEAADSPKGLLTAVAAVGQGGRIVNLGSPRTNVDLARLINGLTEKGASLTGAHRRTFGPAGKGDVWRADRELYLQLIAKGAFRGFPYDIVQGTNRDDVNLLYEDIVRKRRLPGAILLAWRQ